MTENILEITQLNKKEKCIKAVKELYVCEKPLIVIRVQTHCDFKAKKSSVLY